MKPKECYSVVSIAENAAGEAIFVKALQPFTLTVADLAFCALELKECHLTGRNRHHVGEALSQSLTLSLCGCPLRPLASIRHSHKQHAGALDATPGTECRLDDDL